MAFQYNPLDRLKREIRLLVMDSTAKDRLKCEIVTTSLDLYMRPSSSAGEDTESVRHSVSSETLLPFHALSYVWGDPAPVCDIEVNGLMTKISHKLSDALSSIRDNTDYHIIWVDALCINQDDNEEKSWQIQQMTSIFAAAECVISWLGAQKDDSEMALGFLQDLMECLTSVEWEVNWHKPTFGAPVAAIGLARTVEQNPVLRAAIMSLASRPYWKRVWVFQELASARHNVFLCGNETSQDIKYSLYILWLWFSVSMQVLWRTGNLVPDSCWSMLAALFHVINTHPRWTFRPARLIDLLLDLANLEATDGRDKVFALLPVAEDSHLLGIIPDYKKDETRILIETACALLRRGYVTRLIPYACSSERRRLRLPSWVPDWDSSKWPTDFLYDASGKKAQSNGALSSLPIDGLYLKLEGYAIDHVQRTSETLWQHVFRRFGAFFDLCPFVMRSWLGQIENFVAESLTREPTMVDEILARLLVDDFIERATVERLGPFGSSDNPYTNIKINLERLFNNPHDDIEGRDYFLEMNRNFYYEGLVFNTTRGYIGRSKERGCQDGDIVAILPSVNVPCILRQIGAKGAAVEDEQYELIDMAYVYGIMDGEYFEKNTEAKIRTFTLV